MVLNLSITHYILKRMDLNSVLSANLNIAGLRYN